MAPAARRARTTPRRRVTGRVPARARAASAGFHGTGGTLFGIRIVNLFLAIVTLGVYWFWGKARTRRYLWSQSSFAGDRFAYHGTGMEALRGWLKAAAIFGIPYLVLSYAPGWIKMGMLPRIAFGLLASLVVFAFIPVAIAGARRYRLSRTAWRGIRFSFRARTWEFVKLYWKGAILTTLTLGLYYPEFAIRRTRFLIDRTWLGNRRFSFDGEAKELKPSFWAAWGASVIGGCLTIPVAVALSMFLGKIWPGQKLESLIGGLLIALMFMAAFTIPWFWFGMVEKRFIWNHTKFGRARFRSGLAFGPYARLMLGNAALLVFTLGIAAPWVTVRTLRFHLERIGLVGALAPGRIAQQARDTTATGEEAGDLFDFDIELG